MPHIIMVPFAKAAMWPKNGRVDTRGSFGMIVRKNAAGLGSAFDIIGCVWISFARNTLTEAVQRGVRPLQTWHTVSELPRVL